MAEKSTFQINMIRARNSYGWSQEEAAKNIGIKRPTLAAYEEGRSEPGFDILQKICKAYNIKNVSAFIFDPDFTASDKALNLTDVQKQYLRLRGTPKAAVDVLLKLNS
jgi:transcriptional regulator with XRE-family HTH domain